MTHEQALARAVDLADQLILARRRLNQCRTALVALLHYRPSDIDQRWEPERQAWWAAERVVTDLTGGWSDDDVDMIRKRANEALES